MDSLSGVGGSVLIGGPDFGGNALTNLSGLDCLKSIGGSLYICRNSNLTSLDALINLHSIGGDLYIYKNNALETLSGLDNIEEQSIDSLTILDNNILSTCNVQSVCDYLASPNGTIKIQENASGCNSQEEVEAVCGVGVEEPSVGSRRSAVSGQQSAVIIYPNPSSTTITIEKPETSAKFQFSIFNLLGQDFLSGQITEPLTEFDISTLRPGVYFVRITTDRKAMVGKFVKK